jgi:hypothetical protein
VNPLAQVKDYQSMLNRIFVCTSIVATIATWLLRLHFIVLDDLLSVLDVKVEIWGVKEMKIFGYVLPGMAVGFLARTVRLHDRISDVLGIRRRFDIDKILRPLAEGSGYPVGDLNLATLRKKRGSAMGRTFYRYASSTDPKIDKHLIYEALDWWSWYWAQLEATAVLLPTGIALLLSTPRWHGYALLVGCLLVWCVSLPFFRYHCARYAQSQVDEILSDAERARGIQQEFNAL